VVKAPRSYYQEVAVPNTVENLGRAHVRSLIRSRLVDGMAEYILDKEVVRTVGDYTTTYRLGVYVLSADELEKLIQDRVARGSAGMPYYHG